MAKSREIWNCLKIRHSFWLLQLMWTTIQGFWDDWRTHESAHKAYCWKVIIRHIVGTVRKLEISVRTGNIEKQLLRSIVRKIFRFVSFYSRKMAHYEYIQRTLQAIRLCSQWLGSYVASVITNPKVLKWLWNTGKVHMGKIYGIVCDVEVFQMIKWWFTSICEETWHESGQSWKKGVKSGKVC